MLVTDTPSDTVAADNAGHDAATGGATSVLRVLVVDDQTMQRLIVRRALENMGHQVREADSGLSALERLHEEPADMIISDWLMDGMDGLQLCKAVREHAQWPYIYFMLMSSRDTRDDLLAGLNAGADDYLPKPLDLDELTVRIRIGQRLLDLQASLQDRNARLDAALDHINQDIAAASEFQRALLPQESVQSDRSAYAWTFLPSSTVSGDSLNCFRLDENHTGFYNVDVAGHGVASGMVGMLMAQSLDPRSSGCVLRRFDAAGATEITPVSEAAAALNSQMTAFALGTNYLTCLYGVLDERSGKVSFVRAGHTLPVVVRANGSTDVIDEDGDMPIGLFDFADFHELNLQLDHGDRLVLYSDGVTEAESADGTQFEIGRFCDFLAQTAHLPMAQVLESFKRRLQQWSQRSDSCFADDVSILIVEYVGDPMPKTRDTDRRKSDEY